MDIEMKQIAMPAQKRIALIAHDNMKQDLLDWTHKNLSTLQQHTLFATGTTGHLLERSLKTPITKLISGPLGGDQQIGALLTEQKLDMIIFFWDPFEPMPHDPDVKALLRVAAVWNVAVACNRSTADFMISSPLLNAQHQYKVPDYERYLEKRIPSSA
ncbi:methylglyoxal synthase [Amphritea sp. 1_MG-2023]|uniref:methylglyoxal synthase n=1 Tax=Amphritea sp. 1_MG-2023 TaxID=3062670 RepID=UPI0026E42A7C|nr:methylglyoxal synthase [Amphritea sp. 1_MG-2023]MDO6563321.1 methylglyoxal synthase [Amphritea sp. 1_MG-2023]